MNIKDIVSLAKKGTTLEQIKAINSSEQSDDLIELIKSGVSYEDALELASLAGQESPGSEPPPADDDPEDDKDPADDWEQKYNDLLKKTQLEKQRENNAGEEQSDEDILKDLARAFM